VLRKLDVYLKSGVSAVWVLDPHAKRAEIHRPGEPPLRLGLGDGLEDENLLPGFSVILGALFEG